MSLKCNKYLEFVFSINNEQSMPSKQVIPVVWQPHKSVLALDFDFKVASVEVVEAERTLSEMIRS